MTDEDRAQRRVDGDRELFAIRRAERTMAAVGHELAHDLDEFKTGLDDAERRLEVELREEHSGHDPERPLSWRSAAAER